MAVELVIFDCDGVLVDSEAISNRVLAAMQQLRSLEPLGCVIGEGAARSD